MMNTNNNIKSYLNGTHFIINRIFLDEDPLCKEKVISENAFSIQNKCEPGKFLNVYGRKIEVKDVEIIHEEHKIKLVNLHCWSYINNSLIYSWITRIVFILKGVYNTRSNSYYD